MLERVVSAVRFVMPELLTAITFVAEGSHPGFRYCGYPLAARVLRSYSIGDVQTDVR